MSIFTKKMQLSSNIHMMITGEDTSDTALRGNFIRETVLPRISLLLSHPVFFLYSLPLESFLPSLSFFLLISLPLESFQPPCYKRKKPPITYEKYYPVCKNEDDIRLIIFPWAQCKKTHTSDWKEKPVLVTASSADDQI